MPLTTRQKGSLKLLAGAAGYAVVWLMILDTGEPGPGRGGPLALVGIAAPGVLALVGAAELATGRALTDLEGWWSGLRRWQRGVYGVSAVMLVVVVLFGGLGLYAYLRDG